MALNIEDIENMSIDEVKKKYNEIASHTSNALNTWQNIYNMKKQDELNNQLKNINIKMLNYTKWMTLLTVIILIATIINIFITVNK